jgi:hypothetical protein
MSASLLASGHPHDHGKIKRMKFAVGLALLSFFVSAAHAQEAADASASKVALAFVEAVNTGQYEQIPDLIAGDAVWVMPGRMPISGRHRGRDAIMQFLGAAGAGLEPGSVRLDVQTIVSDGPFGVLEWQHLEPYSGRSALQQQLPRHL